MFRFSIRELMLVTLVVGLGLGWLVHWQNTERRHKRTVEYVNSLKVEFRQTIGERDAYREVLMRSHNGDIIWFAGTLPQHLEKEP